MTARRRGAYAVIERDGEVAVVRRANGYLMLPGGGLEAGETVFEGLHREVWEECGFGVEVLESLGQADEDVTLADGRVLLKRSAFYRVRPISPRPEGQAEFLLL